MFENRTVIVTGGVSGLGKGCVELFSSQGANVIVADLDETKGTEMVAQLNEKDENALFIKCDVSKFEDVERMVSQTVQKFGQIDVLVNNAGNTSPPCFCTELENEEWQSVIDVHVNGTFYCTKLAAREMKKKNYGRIINLSSMLALYGLSGQCSYAAAKGAIISFTYSLAKELGPYGITVNALQPGLIRSNITAPFLETIESQLVDNIPINSIGEPEDIAELVVFLASSRARYINGSCIVIDGGYTLNLPVLDKFTYDGSSGV